MEEASLGHRVPIELIDGILMWVMELHRVDAIIRAEEFHKKMGGVWSLIMEDVRANTPLYSLQLQDSDGNICNVNFLLPNCDTGRLIAMITLHQTFEEYTLLTDVRRRCIFRP